MREMHDWRLGTLLYANRADCLLESHRWLTSLPTQPILDFSAKRLVNEAVEKSQFSGKMASLLIDLQRGDFGILSFSAVSTLEPGVKVRVHCHWNDWPVDEAVVHIPLG